MRRILSLIFVSLLQDSTHLKGCYLAAKAVYESGDDHEEALIILNTGAGIIDKATRDLQKGRSVTGKQGGVSAVGNDGDSAIENTRRVSFFEVVFLSLTNGLVG